jgi:HD-like signal output (HDOD) protein
MHNEGITEWEAERKVLGATHADVGGYLLGIWGLSDSIVEAVAFHHDPARSDWHAFSPLTAIHIANALQETEQAEGMETAPVPLDTEYLTACSLPVQLSIWEAMCRGAGQGRPN